MGIVVILLDARKMFAPGPSTPAGSNPVVEDLCELEVWALQLQVEDELRVAVGGTNSGSMHTDFGESLAKDAMRMLSAVEAYVTAMTVR